LARRDRRRRNDAEDGIDYLRPEADARLQNERQRKE
jgi:hypothetical protein